MYISHLSIMRLRNTSKATKVRQYWARKNTNLKKKYKRENRMLKLNQAHPPQSEPVKKSFLTTYVFPILKEIGSMFFQQAMFEVIKKTMTATNTVAQ